LDSSQAVSAGKQLLFLLRDPSSLIVSSCFETQPLNLEYLCIQMITAAKKINTSRR
jgi:hypothetical protein